jgi:hypothetical protein
VLPSTNNKFFLLPSCSFFIAVFLLGISFTAPVTTYGQNTVWEKPFAGNDPSVLYYPDQNAVYFRYAWENKHGKGLVIKGKMPEARYFSFNLYNDYTKSSIIAKADVEIQPDAGDSTSYTIHIMPDHTAGPYQNLIILPDSVKSASIFLRYYLARGDIFANRPLPTINMLDAGNTKSPLPSIPQPSMSSEDMARLKKLVMANPKMISGKERKVLTSSSSTFEEKEPIISKVLTLPIFSHYTNPDNISAYRFNPGGNYPNKDNHYILMPVVRKKQDVLVVRFKAPTHSFHPGYTSSQVRYFSLSQGNEYTNTSITLYDEQLKVSSDGFIYVVVANDKKELRELASEMGINFMPWLYKERLVLILRHMLPAQSFTTSTREVPLFDKTKPAKGQEAEMAIGEYALVGKFIKAKNFKTVGKIETLGFK